MTSVRHGESAAHISFGPSPAVAAASGPAIRMGGSSAIAMTILSSAGDWPPCSGDNSPVQISHIGCLARGSFSARLPPADLVQQSGMLDETIAVSVVRPVEVGYRSLVPGPAIGLIPAWFCCVAWPTTSRHLASLFSQTVLVFLWKRFRLLSNTGHLLRGRYGVPW